MQAQQAVQVGWSSHRWLAAENKHWGDWLPRPLLSGSQLARLSLLLQSNLLLSPLWWRPRRQVLFLLVLLLQPMQRPGIPVASRPAICLPLLCLRLCLCCLQVQQLCLHMGLQLLPCRQVSATERAGLQRCWQAHPRLRRLAGLLAMLAIGLPLLPPSLLLLLLLLLALSRLRLHCRCSS